MRHFYTTMLATMVATTSFAQSTVKTQSLLEANTVGTVTTCPIKQQAKVLPFGAKKTNFRLPNFAKKTTLSPALRAKRAAAEDMPMISEQPQGTLYANYYGNEAGYEIFWGGVVSTEIDGAAENFVVADNGDVYLKDAMSTLRQGNWIKGHKAEGDTIVFNFPQKYYQQEAEDEKGNPTGGMEYCYLWRTILSDGRDTFIPDPTSQTIKYVFRNDSLIRVDDFKDGIYLSLADADGVWVGYNDFRSTWTKCKDQIAVLPATAKPEKYQLDYFFNANGQSDTRIINVATDGNDIYLGNLSDGNPDGWVKGELKDGKAYFKGMNYLGVEDGVDAGTSYHTYFSPAGSVKQYFEDFKFTIDSVYFRDEIIFDYNAETKSLKSDSLFIINVGKKDIYALTKFYNSSMAPWIEKPGTPKKPFLYDFLPYKDGAGKGGIQFDVEYTSTDGVYLDPNKMYYNIYFDDEIHTFYSDEYKSGLPGDTDEVTDIPLNYNNNVDIMAYNNSRIVYFYTTGFESFGIQLLYKDGDKVYKSDMAKFVFDEEGEPVAGIKNATANNFSSAVKSVSYTDLSGRTISKPNKGIYMKTVRFADGTQKTIKYIKK